MFSQRLRIGHPIALPRIRGATENAVIESCGCTDYCWGRVVTDQQIHSNGLQHQDNSECSCGSKRLRLGPAVVRLVAKRDQFPAERVTRFASRQITGYCRLTTHGRYRSASTRHKVLEAYGVEGLSAFGRRRTAACSRISAGQARLDLINAEPKRAADYTKDKI